MFRSFVFVIESRTIDNWKKKNIFWGKKTANLVSLEMFAEGGGTKICSSHYLFRKCGYDTIFMKLYIPKFVASICYDYE